MPTDYRLPINDRDWRAQVKLQQLSTTSIHSPHVHRSGSNIDFDQYLLLRVLRPRRYAANDLNGDKINDWVDKSHVTWAEESLRKFSPFRQYLDSVHQYGPSTFNQVKFPYVGTFSLVLYYQMACGSTNGKARIEPDDKITFSPSPKMTRNRARVLQGGPESTPSRTNPSRYGLLQGPDVEADMATMGSSHLDKYAVDDSVRKNTVVEDSALWEDSDELEDVEIGASPRSPESGAFARSQAVEDEQIVNTALILYLNALTMFMDTYGRWSLSRQAFVVSTPDGRGGRDKVFEARVDGVLRQSANSSAPARSIVEVKPQARGVLTNGYRVRMQEAAQMAAWICENPPPRKVIPSDEPFDQPPSSPGNIVSSTISDRPAGKVKQLISKSKALADKAKRPAKETSNPDSATTKASGRTTRPMPSTHVPESEMGALVGKMSGLSTRVGDQPNRSKPASGGTKDMQHRRILVSQNRNEIYLTFATFDDAYVDYITGKTYREGEEKHGGSGKASESEEISFLSLAEYGPFALDSRSHMEAFAVYLLALTRQECTAE